MRREFERFRLPQLLRSRLGHPSVFMAHKQASVEGGNTLRHESAEAASISGWL